MTPTLDRGQTSEATGNRCSFCGKSREDVRTLVVSRESAICDECIATALYTISHQRGHFFIRIAFLAFRAVASLDRLLNSSLGTRKQRKSGSG